MHDDGYKRTGLGLRKLGPALANSLRGLRDAARHEAAFRQELFAVAVLAPLALWLPFSAVERMLLLGSLVLVLIVELLNSAIETTLDRVSVERHELSRRAKDIGSAAVLLAVALAALVWLLLLWPQLIRLLRSA
ncbi:MAG TPA: diacylglycerol kinase [Burkholderiaceae bacterium]|jgi:diacylglycerol kinase (ATP)|nr:diacylglycerol kinase [Burkholderiaceae bacterium]